MKQYFLKLVNGEKFECSKKAFDNWLQNVSGDYIVIETPNGNNCYIKKDRILLGFDLNLSNYDDTKGKK